MNRADRAVRADRAPADIDADREFGVPEPECDRVVAFGLSRNALIVTIAVVAITCGQLPLVMYVRWTLRFAALMLVLPLGSIALWRLVRLRDRPAISGLAFVVIGALSTAISGGGLRPLVGGALVDSTPLIYGSTLALWALGRLLSDRDRRAVELVLIATLAINVAVGLIQVLASVEGGTMNVSQGRASGLLANAVYFGSAVTGALGWAAWRSLRAGRRHDLVLTAWFALGVGLSGSRVALLASVVGVVGCAVAVGMKRLPHTAAALCVGLGAAWAAGERSARRTTISRLATSGSDGRTEIWSYGFEAFRDRPLFGWGMGRFRVAVQGRFSEEFTRRLAADDTVQSWTDPHNVLVMVVVTTGIIGAIVVAAFGWQAVRTSQGPLRAFAVFTALTWSAQPASMHSLPLAVLALGLSAPVVTLGMPKRSVRTDQIAVVVGFALLALVTVPSVVMRRAVAESDPDVAEQVAPWFVGDPVTADLVSNLFIARSGRTDADVERALVWSQRAIDAEPSNPRWHAGDALRAIVADDRDRARSSTRRALDLQPTHVAALEAQFLLAVIEGDPQVDSAKAQLCAVDADRCADLGD